MLNTVVVIKELVDFMSGTRRDLAVYSSRAEAEAWIENSGGDQLVFLDNGEIEPLYLITERVV